MRKLLVTLDDDLDKVLATLPNQNRVVRAALELYLSDITEDTLQGLRASYAVITKQLKEIDSKVDYLARKLND